MPVRRRCPSARVSSPHIMTNTQETRTSNFRGLRLTDRQLEIHCQEWIRWCNTRKFYTRPISQGLLARLQQSKSKDEPHIRNNPDMQFFNAAVHSLAEMPDEADGYACFRARYIETSDLIRVHVEKLGITRPTYYARARSFARMALSLADSLKNAHMESMARPAAAEDED